ncbi:MAG: response regulator receiver modulated sensor-containing diguanylate [Betaproteobacteria bacterium]|nr:response regulator receiver modulated sensor-containing diguanylate [Betaproteobacteria bacterium]
MSTAVRILLAEDSKTDADLTARALRRGGFEPAVFRVQDRDALMAALADGPWDAVISDYSMPGFTGMEALSLVRAADPDVPFILMSGTVGEETVVAALKEGANNYLMKGNLARLAPALERELKEARARADHRRMQRELVESERRYGSLLQNIHLATVMLDRDANITYCNEFLLQMTGWRLEEVVGRNWFKTFMSAELGDMTSYFRSLLDNTGDAWLRENEIHARGGERRLMRWSNSILRSANGEVSGVASIGEDITERRAAEERVAHLNRVYAMLSGINSLIVRVRNRDELFAEACRIAVEAGSFNAAWIGMVDPGTMRLVPLACAGIAPELLEALKELFFSPVGTLDGSTMVARAMRDRKPVISNDMTTNPAVVFGTRHLAAGTRSMAILPLVVGADAVGVLALYSGRAEFFDEEGIKLLSELAGDIAFAIDHIDKQARLDYLAYYDTLTGLANRKLFLERLAQYMRSATAAGHKLALYLVDLERFKNINDTLGRPAGDALLQQVAQWMTQTVGDANFLGRIGADHFAIVIPKIQKSGDVTWFLEKSISAFMDHPFRLGDIELRIAAKGGIALFPDDGGDADTLFRHAEAALRKAKVTGERYLFYTQKMTDAMAGKLVMENQLRQALQQGEFVLHYQPKFNLGTGKLAGAEALIRWNDPRTGLVPPGRFIPILEETGLIYDVGRWALHCALADYLRWRAAGLPVVRIAVNMSPLQLRNKDFVGEISQAVGISAQAAAGLELEITESLIMEDVHHSIASLQAIRALGVCVAIDDFGTGFSSLSYLSRLPVDILKIDRSFVVDMTTGPGGLALVSTVISLARALKLKVVAEGVETEEQSRLLQLLGCDEVQGFLFGKPVPAEVFEEKWLGGA